MKRITLTVLLVAAASAALAQDPPVPPRPATPPRAARPAEPMPAPRALAPLAPTPRALIDPEFEYHMRLLDRDMLAPAAAELRLRADEMRAMKMDDMRWELDAARLAMTEAPRAIEALREMPVMPAMAGTYVYADRLFSARPPAAWAQGDPGDSLWRAGSDAVVRGDYRRAVQTMNDLLQKYPKSNYAADAAYWEAYSRYRLGSTDDLRAAAKTLEMLASRAAEMPRLRSRDADVPTLNARVIGALAQRGDRDAQDKIRTEAQKAGGAACDKEDIAVRVEALNALGQMDPAAAMPILRRVLEKKDECSADLRYRAVLLLGRRADNESAGLLTQAAKSDPAVNVRSAAIDLLPRMPGDGWLGTLEEILKSDQEERVQRAAVRALMTSDNPRARSVLRALIERKDASTQLRSEAIGNFDKDRGTADDAKYLREVYGKIDNDRVKESIIGAVARMGGAENEQWLLNLAKNNNESYQLRSAALSRLSRSSTISVADIGKLFDAADSRNMREQLIQALGNRKEPESIDVLAAIAKTPTNEQRLRQQAINALLRKGDPRAQKIVLDLIDKP